MCIPIVRERNQLKGNSENIGACTVTNGMQFNWLNVYENCRLPANISFKFIKSSIRRQDAIYWIAVAVLLNFILFESVVLWMLRSQPLQSATWIYQLTKHLAGCKIDFNLTFIEIQYTFPINLVLLYASAAWHETIIKHLYAVQTCHWFFSLFEGIWFNEKSISPPLD